jgi:aryl-alcohol dehydrogenase-like predicted oxidoreductase
MEKIRLGNTKLEVSRLCYGTEPFTIKKGPIGRKAQGDVSPVLGGEILRKAFERGINFWDTSDDYFSHPHVAEGLKRVNRKDVIITDKTNAHTFEEGEEAVKKALVELGTDYIDIMMLHIVPFKTHLRQDAAKKKYESGNLKKRMGTLKAFMEAKESGIIKAIGLSTHSTEVLKQTLDYPEIEVVLTVLNKRGSFIEDGSLERHLEAIKKVYDSHKGIYVCKILDAGKLRDEAESSIKYVLKYDSFIHAWDIGMYNAEDIEKNIRLFQECLKSK